MKIRWVGNKEIWKEYVDEKIDSCLASGHFSNFGANVGLLEQFSHERFGIDDDKVVITVTNGACGIESLVCGLCHHYDRQLRFAVQSFTFPCSQQGILRNSVMIDISPETMGPCLVKLKEKLDQYDGIMVTNCFGFCVDIQAYVDFCREHNKLLLFDNAASPLTKYKGSNLLNYGIGSVISFHHTKPIGFGEGGLIIVDKKYADDVRKVSNFGYCPEDKYTYSSYGSNHKMSDLSAIYILQWLKYYCATIEIDYSRKMEIFDLLAHNQELDLKYLPSFHDKDEPHVASTIAIMFDRPADHTFFVSKGIEAKKYYHPLGSREDYPYSWHIFDHILCLPLNFDVDIEKMTDMLYAIKEYLSTHK